MNTIKKLLIPGTILFVGLLTAQIVYSCQLVIDGKEVKRIDQDIEQLRQQVSLKEEKVASASSLLTIREKSASMGFIEFPKVFTFNQDMFVVAFGQTR
ncbi:MAG: hypothetical protein V1917_02300 [Candidatus Gottesmanbacteria bacterium]